MPTFGSSTIRRFATNASEMKKLAARDFEDILQVWSMISSKEKEKTNSCICLSAVSQHLKDCCKSLIIQSSSRSYTEQQNGMPSQNFGYTQRILYSTLKGLRQSLVSWCESLGMSRSPGLQHSNFQRRQEHENGAKSLERERRRQLQVILLGVNPKPWISSHINGMHWGTMSALSVSLVEQMGSQPNWSVIFIFTYLIFSQLPAPRVNLLIKSLNDCMDRPTNTMQRDKSPSVIEDFNTHVWRLTAWGSSSMPVLSKNQWITKMIRWRVTRTCGITSLHRKIDLWTYLTPFGITEATLPTTYALLFPIILTVD